MKAQQASNAAKAAVTSGPHILCSQALRNNNLVMLVRIRFRMRHKGVID